MGASCKTVAIDAGRLKNSPIQRMEEAVQWWDRQTEAHVESGYSAAQYKTYQLSKVGTTTPQLNKLDNDLFANPLRKSLLEHLVKNPR